jgi:hypothetical protein
MSRETTASAPSRVPSRKVASFMMPTRSLTPDQLAAGRLRSQAIEGHLPRWLIYGAAFDTFSFGARAGLIVPLTGLR